MMTCWNYLIFFLSRELHTTYVVNIPITMKLKKNYNTKNMLKKEILKRYDNF